MTTNAEQNSAAEPATELRAEEASAREISYWLVNTAASGTRLRLDYGGVLIGRNTSCDIVLTDPRVSRHHALVRLGDQGPELVKMGRAPVGIRRGQKDAGDGQTQDCALVLRDGDRIDICGRTFLITRSIERNDAADAGPGRWVIERGADTLYRIPHSPFTVGGSPRDDLVIEAWSPGALCFRLAQNALVVEARVALTMNDYTLACGEIVTAHIGDILELSGESIRVLAILPSGQRTTLVDPGNPLPREIRLQRLPNGEGRLSLTFPGGTKSICMSALRADLMTCLLDPPAPYQAGAIVPDEVTCARIWPDSPGRDRTDLNTLAFRIRRSLVKAGINGAELLTRTGGGTRINLSPTCQIDLC